MSLLRVSMGIFLKRESLKEASLTMDMFAKQKRPRFHPRYPRVSRILETILSGGMLSS
jgi:hypothetical protein